MADEPDAGTEAATGTDAGADATTTQTTQQTQQTKAAGQTEARPAGAAATTAAGTTATAADQVKPVWPDDWRERMAAQVGGEDKKAVAKELKRLQRMADPTAVYGSFRELDAKFSEGGLVKVPGPKATPEEKAAFAKAVGAPEKPEDYLTDLKLGDGKVLGEDDKPAFTEFAKAMHPTGMTKEQAGAALNWYYDNQEKQAAAQYDADQTFANQTRTELKEEWGQAMDANIRAIPSIFAKAPGGADPDNPESLMGRLLGGRTADGKIIGDDPTITKWLASLALEINPAATIVPTGGMEGALSRLEEIRKLRRENPDKYNADKKMQDEELRLIEVELKQKNRGRQAA